MKFFSTLFLAVLVITSFTLGSFVEKTYSQPVTTGTGTGTSTTGAAGTSGTAGTAGSTTTDGFSIKESGAPLPSNLPTLGLENEQSPVTLVERVFLNYII